MRRVSYTDPDGRKWVTEIPNDAPDSHADMGIPVGPPEIVGEGWPDELCVRVQNALVDRGIITWQDFRRRRKEAVGAVNSALGSMVTRVERLYHDDAN